ncbi:MAG: SgcJ/EcaC family oxidoreductase [Gemmatimonadales bacterium]|nr:SgcJ/EcaC family oxidoreductase [Gemmatimonadales bacterium]
MLLLSHFVHREVMRLPASLLALSLVLPGSLAGQSRADSIAVLHVIELRAEAQRTHDAHAERAIYAPDAVWINAFGRRRVGPDSIAAFLGRLYADSGYAASRLVRAEVPDVRFIRPDVAVVHEYHEREGQRLADGTVIPLRRVHTTMVLAKEGGRWLVHYLSIGDERERSTPPAP